MVPREGKQRGGFPAGGFHGGSFEQRRSTHHGDEGEQVVLVVLQADDEFGGLGVPLAFARALDAGLILVGAGDHTLRLLPPLVITRDDLAAGLAALETAIG